MLFASETVFAGIYWNFGTIFEIVAASFSFVGILLWTSERSGWLQVLVASLVILLAVKGKEMALTLPRKPCQRLPRHTVINEQHPLRSSQRFSQLIEHLLNAVLVVKRSIQENVIRRWLLSRFKRCDAQDCVIICKPPAQALAEGSDLYDRIFRANVQRKI
jgi:hypothetical protein